MQDEELGEGESERKWEAEEVERRERRDYNYQEEEYMERREAEWEERDSYRERWEGWTYPESDWREEYYYGHYGYQRWREDYPDTAHQRRWSYDSYYDKDLFCKHQNYSYSFGELIKPKGCLSIQYLFNFSLNTKACLKSFAEKCWF